MIKRTASFGKAIKRSASFGRRNSAGDRSKADAPRVDRSASLLSSDELDDSIEPSPAPLPRSSSPSVSCGLSALQGLLLKRHQSSKWTKWGKRWFEVDDYKRTLSYYATEVLSSATAVPVSFARLASSVPAQTPVSSRAGQGQRREAVVHDCV